MTEPYLCHMTSLLESLAYQLEVPAIGSKRLVCFLDPLAALEVGTMGDGVMLARIVGTGLGKME